MAYHVVLADSASADAYAIYDHVAAAAPVRGPQWFDELMECLHTLDHLPMRCSLAREAGIAGRPIRCLLLGKRRNVYRVLYEVDEKRKTVWVLHIRHGARKDLEMDEIHPPDL